jgi:hypothetical protein
MRMISERNVVPQSRELFSVLAKYARTCYHINRILEVFAVHEATKTFDFVAFLLPEPSEI